MSNIVSFIFKATDSLSRPLQRMADAAAALNNRMQRVRATMGRLAARADVLRRKLKGLGRTAISFGKGLLTSITLPLTLAGGVFLKAASDAEEAQQKFNVVFRNVRTNADAATVNLSKNFALSTRDAQGFLSSAGNIFKGLGFSSEAALDMSNKITTLGVDLASFTNIEGGAKRAVNAITSALLGEREALKGLDIKISELNVNRKVGELINKGARFETLEQAKAQATLALIFEKSKDAQGDFARSSGSLANQVRETQARLSDVSSEIGTILIPLALKLAKLLQFLARGFSSLSPLTKKIIVFFGVFVAILPPLIILVGVLAFAIGAMTLPIALTIAAVVALIAIGRALFMNWDIIKKKSVEVFNKIKETILSLAPKVSFVIGLVTGKFLDFIGLNEQVRDKVVDVFKTVKDTIGEAIDFALKKIKAFIDFVTPSFKEMGSVIKNAFSTATGFVSDKFTANVTPLLAAIPSIPDIPTPPPGANISQAFQAGFSNQRSTTDVNINLNAPKGTVEKIDSKTRGNIDNLNLGLNMQTGTGG